MMLSMKDVLIRSGHPVVREHLERHGGKKDRKKARKGAQQSKTGERNE
jgi:hypothetical protein